MSSRKNVVIRPSRLQMLGCWSGCSVFLGGLVIFGLQSMLALRAIFPVFTIWAYGVGLLALGALILWYFFEGIPRAWNQRVVFEARSLYFQDDSKEQTLRYDEIEGVEVQQSLFTGFDGGFNHVPSHKILFRCRPPQLPTVTCRTHIFSLRSVLKVLCELSSRMELDHIRITRMANYDNERELRRAAVGLGEISVDEEEKCFWFKPLGS